LPVEAEPVLERKEVVALLFAVYDMLQEVRAIRRLLEGNDEEEEEGLSD
jgi:hypothetical protein